MDNTLSSALLAYYTHERKTLATEPAVRAELHALGVAYVDAEYDGVGDSGQIEQIVYRDASDPAQPASVGEPTNERVEALLYALLNLRHGGWENNDGAFGTFSWNLSDGTLEHQHHERYTDYRTSVHRDFENGTGEDP